MCHCLLAYKRHQIKALQDTFITVSLEKVAKGVVLSSVDNAEKEIQDMIDRKELSARIDKETKMIASLTTKSFIMMKVHLNRCATSSKNRNALTIY